MSSCSAAAGAPGMLPCGSEGELQYSQQLGRSAAVLAASKKECCGACGTGAAPPIVPGLVTGGGWLRQAKAPPLRPGLLGLAMMMKSLSKGSPHVALLPPHLHGIPARAWDLRQWPPVHNARHIEICKKPSHALCLHTGLPKDGRPFTPRHLIHPIPLNPPPPVAMLVMPMFQKRLMLSEMSPPNMANPNGQMVCNMASTSCSRLRRYHDAVPRVL